jgi:SAM-dependent methyltransferase
MAGRDLPKELSDLEYLRCRLNPSVRDYHYLHLSDLLIGISDYTTEDLVKILDYGAGGSPYRSLFPNSAYSRADIVTTDETDFPIRSNGTIAVKDGAFDMILSTQVLEHCESPSIYLNECFRLLRNGGHLLLTTHGTYQDHGCPYDFRRWTADGLVKDIESAGFVVESAKKLTANGRAVAFILLEHSGLLCTAQSGVWRFLARTAYKVIQRLRPFLQKQADGLFPNYRVVDSSESGVHLYIALLVSARKP